MSNDVTLAMVSVTPCLPTTSRCEEIVDVGVLAQSKIQVHTEPLQRTYVVHVRGNLEPSHYAVEIVGETATPIRGDTFMGCTSSVAGDPWQWTFTLHGPAFDRFTVRLVCVLKFWKFDDVLRVDDSADSPYAGHTLRCSYDEGEDLVGVFVGPERMGPVAYLPRAWLTAVG